MIRRGFGSPTLFAIVYTAIASSIYFALGVVADHALGLTPVVFLVAGFFFLLTTMTYVEGASLHQERGGSTVFARYAFNELVSFIAGWAILLDYVILIAITAFTATNYLAAFWAPFGRGAVETGLAVAIVVYVALLNVRGVTASIIQRRAVFAVLDFVVQVVVIVLGLALVFSPDVLTDSIDLGTSPTWGDLVFAGDDRGRRVHRASSPPRGSPARSRSAAAGCAGWSGWARSRPPSPTSGWASSR